jgi:hypothetical protein
MFLVGLPVRALVVHHADLQRRHILADGDLGGKPGGGEVAITIHRQ